MVLNYWVISPVAGSRNPVMLINGHHHLLRGGIPYTGMSGLYFFTALSPVVKDKLPKYKSTASKMKNFER